MVTDWMIQIENFKVNFPHTQAIFEPISLTIPRRTIYGIFGETGCGKSTLAKSLLGFLPCEYWHGKITLRFEDGLTIQNLPTADIQWQGLRGTRIVYVPQDPYQLLNPYETVERQLWRVYDLYHKNKTTHDARPSLNITHLAQDDVVALQHNYNNTKDINYLRHGSNVRTEEATKTLMNVLQQVQLDTELLPYHSTSLSAGQCQRAGLACALLTPAELLILDEPLAALDTLARETLVNTLRNLTKDRTIVMISHEEPKYHEMIAPENRFYFPCQHDDVREDHATPASSINTAAPKIEQNGTAPTTSANTNPNKTLLRLDKITKIWDGLVVFDRLQLAIGYDQWLYLQGQNGSGKTTLLNILLGIYPPDLGHFFWSDQHIPWHQVKEHNYNSIHPIFQNAYPSFHPRYTVKQILQEVYVKTSPQQKVDMIEWQNQWWQELQLPYHVYHCIPSQLSYGQQKRMAILRMILKYRRMALQSPDAWHLFILDEALSGIHRSLRLHILQLFQNLRKQGKFSMIWVGHDDPDLAGQCDAFHRLE